VKIAPQQVAGTEAPGWVERGRVVVLIDADLALDRGDNPLGLVTRALSGLTRGELVQVTAAFKPAPLIDTLAVRDLQIYTQQLADGRWRTWIGPRSNGKQSRGESHD